MVEYMDAASDYIKILVNILDYFKEGDSILSSEKLMEIWSDVRPQDFLYFSAKKRNSNKGSPSLGEKTQ